MLESALLRANAGEDESVDLPVIDPPVFPRWIWIEEITYSHITLATYITACMVLAPVFEYIGWRRRDARYDRLAVGLIWFSLTLFSPGAALGTGIPMWLMGTYPEFWSRWSNLFFWPLMAQFVFFIFEVIFLFLLYYLLWNWSVNHKRFHILLGAVAAFWGLAVQVVWDSVGGYMTTPNVRLPGVDEPVAWSLKACLNPSFPFLFSHRFVGNISWAMLMTGGALALRSVGRKPAEDRAYYNWAAHLCFTVGFVAFFGMPVIGWFYAQVMGRHAPVAFHAIMGGHQGWMFIVKMALIALFVLIGGAYVFLRYQSRLLLWGMTAGLALLWVVLTVHPPLKWLGDSALVWRAAYTVALAAFAALLWAIRGRWSVETRGWKWAMFVAGLAAFLAFCIGGMVREGARQPQTVYGQLEKPETLPRERDRFLLYERCVQCHHRTVNEFNRYDHRRSWADILSDKDHRGVWKAPDEQARLLRYLEEYYR
ncbi:MAG: hypothetical protein FJ291_16305 [Planctomycetes bacterium]|nr:hypothetical protein [Planctomycetota bacterium]